MQKAEPGIRSLSTKHADKKRNVFRLEKDIGDDNAVALCRNDGILLK